MNNYIFPEELDNFQVDGAEAIITATADGNSVQFTQEGDADDVVQVDGLGDLFQDLSERNPIQCEIETVVDGGSPGGAAFTLIRSAVQSNPYKLPIIRFWSKVAIPSLASFTLSVRSFTRLCNTS